MNKKFLLLMFVMLCFSSIVFAGVTDDVVFNYGNQSSGTILIDLAERYNGTMVDGASLSGWNLTLDGVNDHARLDNPMGDNARTHSIWAKSDITDYTLWGGIIGDLESTGGMLIQIDRDTDQPQLIYRTASSYVTIDATGITITDWNWYTATYDGSKFCFYVNNVLQGSCGTDTLGTTPNANFELGRDPDQAARYFDGKLANAMVHNRSISSAERSEIYSAGREYDWFYVAPPQTIFEYPYEEVDQLKQSTTVGVASTSPVTVLSGSFSSEVGVNSYMSFSGNIQPTQIPVGVQNCYLELNGVLVEGSNVTYTGAENQEHKSFYKLTDNFTTTQVNNTLEILCYGSNNKNFNVLNSVVHVHQLINTTDYNYTFYSESGNFTVNNLTGFDTIFSRTINTTGFNLSNSNKSVYVLYDSNFQVNYDVDNSAEGYLTLDDVTCPVLKRYGSAGSTGSSSYICLKNVTGQSSFNSTLYVKGDVNVNYQSYIKEMVLEDYEIANNFVENYEINSLNYQDIDSQNITLDTTTKDLLTIASLSIQADSVDQEAVFRFKISSQNGSIMYRDVNVVGQAGIVTNQYLFSGLSATTYEVTLQGKINATTPNTTLLNGSVLYMAVGESDLNVESFTVTAQDEILSTSINSFTASDGVVLSTTTGSLEYPEQAGLINITFSADNYFNTTVYNHNTTQNLQFNATPYPWINFTFNEYFTNTLINNFSIVCNDQTVETTTENKYLLYQMPGNVSSTSCNFTSPDYASFSFNITGIVTNLLNTYNQQVFTTNSILMSFYDQGNLTLITKNITVEVIGSYQTATNSTVTGSTYFDLLSPDTYTIRYSSPGYNTNTYYLTLLNKTTNNITFYMSTNASTVAVTATVYDEKTSFVEDARIKVLVEDPSNPSQYITTQMCDTNFEGVCELDLVLDTKQYKFIIEYPFGVTKKITNPSYIFDTSIDFQIIIGDLAAEDYVATKDVWGVVEYVSDSFTFTYNDPNNGITQGCLKVYSINPTGQTLYSSSCSSSVTDEITANVTAVNGTSYIAQGLVYYNSEAIPVDEAFKSYKAQDSGFGLNGAFLLLFVIITFAAIAMWNPVILITFLPLPLTLGKFMGFIDINWQILLGLHFVFLVIAWMISDRG